MKVSLFDYRLPGELVAQEPIEPRDAAQLMVIDRQTVTLDHHTVKDLPRFIRAGDCLVVNDTRVMPARLLGRREGTGGRVELLLLGNRANGSWEALVKPGARLRPGSRVELPGHLVAVVGERIGEGSRLVAFERGGRPLGEDAVRASLRTAGRVPLPPYIKKPLVDDERYQTVYAREEKSAAAPTAGLHLTPALMSEIEARGARFATVTLRVGLDTFLPVREEEVEAHKIHSEEFSVDEEAAAAVNAAVARGGRVIAIGTTSTRVLETAASGTAVVRPMRGSTRLYIYPGYHFEVVDCLMTNFHLPRSTLLMLVAAFAGRELIMRAYEEAIAERYRFFSFGDAMLIL